MALTKYNTINVSKGKDINNIPPLKKLTRKKKNSGGRNNQGRATIKGRAGGVKKTYRIISFSRKEQGICKVLRIEYDPNRSSNIALIRNVLDKYFYIIAPSLLNKGEQVECSKNAKIKIGNCLPLKYIPIGTQIHNIEMKPGKGGQFARSAGTFALLVNKNPSKGHLKLSSSEIISVNIFCFATIGQVSNTNLKNFKFEKAGRMRWLGRKPKVRGVAMNPIDHPHGGGEGKSSGGRHPVNRKGKYTKGFKTRRNKRTNKHIVKSRHQ